MELETTNKYVMFISKQTKKQIKISTEHSQVPDTILRTL